MTWRAWWMTMIIDGSCHGHIKVFFPPSIKHCLLIEYGKDQKWSNENHVDLEQDWLSWITRVHLHLSLSLPPTSFFDWSTRSERRFGLTCVSILNLTYMHPQHEKKPLCAWWRQRKYARGELRVGSSWVTPEKAVCLRFFFKKKARDENTLVVSSLTSFDHCPLPHNTQKHTHTHICMYI